MDLDSEYHSNGDSGVSRHSSIQKAETKNLNEEMAGLSYTQMKPQAEEEKQQLIDKVRQKLDNFTKAEESSKHLNYSFSKLH